MARATRIALDLALVSLRTVGPVVSKMWISSKDLIANTKARALVCNPLVDKAESAVDKLTNSLMSSLIFLRDRQLPNELKYLEKELEKVKSRMSERKDSSTSKTLKPALGTAWQYAKTEMVPPTTLNFFHGPIGQKLEDTVSKAADGLIVNVENRIKEIEKDAEREIKHKEALVKAAQAKIKAEAKRKAEEAEKKEAEQLAKKAKAKQKTETSNLLEKSAAVESKAKSAPPSKKSQEAKTKQKTETKEAKDEKKTAAASNKRDKPKKTK